MDLGRLRLASIHLRDFGLKHLDLLEELGLPRLGLGNARRSLVELAREVRLLRLRLRRLLVAEGLRSQNFPREESICDSRLVQNVAA